MSAFSVDRVQLKQSDEKGRRCLPWGSEERTLLSSKASHRGYREDGACFLGSFRPGRARQGLGNRERTDTFGEIASKYCILLFFFDSSYLLASLPPLFFSSILCSLVLYLRVLKPFPKGTPVVKWTRRGPSASPTMEVKSFHFIF